MKKILFFLLLTNSAFAQTPNRVLPYSFFFNQKFDRQAYSTTSSFHSSIKTVFTDDSLLTGAIDSIFNYGNEDERVQRSWVHRKLFHEHLLEVNRPDYRFYLDPVLDLEAGKESENGRTTWRNTRGVQVGGEIGKKFSFYTSVLENQARFPGYLNRIINRDSIIPGQTIESHLLANRPVSIADWAYSSAVISYTPVKYVNFQLGYDKNFIGDGYRSMLLSDISSNYPFFKTTFNLGNVRLMSMWAQFEDLHAAKLSYENGYRKKWGVFHYLDWNITRRLSAGLFESVIWEDADSKGKRGFDFSYINPLLLLRPVERKNGSPDNALAGINLKYEVLKNLSLYGQFILDELNGREAFKGTGYWANKWGLQVGLRGFDAFKVKNLNFLAEYNTARPYTFTELEPINNYAHYNQPLAHPFGANFKEFVGIANYAYNRFGFSCQLNSGLYGLDQPGQDFGKDVYKSYFYRQQDYGNYIGQGLRTDFLYGDGRISFMLKPRINFRVEAGMVYRKETNRLQEYKTAWFTLGVKSSFTHFYQDF